MSTRYTIGIDIGGTNVKGGVVDPEGRIVARHSIETRADLGFEASFGRIVRLVQELASGLPQSDAQIAAVGVGVPGPMSHEKGLIHNAPNLPGWVNIPFRDRMTAATKFHCVVENDANAAAFGEFTMGAGRDVQNMVMLTLGTGIGGGIVIGGRLIRGAFDNAGEIGHAIMIPEGRACPCGQRGCLERYSSANAIAERFVEAIAAGEPSSLAGRAKEEAALAARADGRIDSADVLAAAEAGDVLASRIWGEACRLLALAIVNIQHFFNTEQVVLAGGLINAGEKLLTPVRRHFAEQTWRICDDAPRIVLATLGGDAGMLGAAALARG